MSLLVKKELLGLHVETVSGITLGKLVDLELEEQSHLVKFYHVQTSRLLPGFLSDKLMVERGQVVSLSTKKIVVDDSLIKEKASLLQKAPLPEAGGAPLSTLQK